MLKTKEQWEIYWKENMQHYLSKPPRTGNFINYLLKGKIKSTLEIGAGSCRDSIRLFELGYDAVSSDFDPETVNMLKQMFYGSYDKIEVLDTFNIKKDDNSYDLVFHNGLFILFSDQQIITALKEQLRVARKFLLLIIHNKENTSNLNYFNKNKKVDGVYDVRFFSNKEIIELINLSQVKYSKVEFLKFGGPADIFYDKRVKNIKNLFTPFAHKFAPFFYKFQKANKVERIACLITK